MTDITLDSRVPGREQEKRTRAQENRKEGTRNRKKTEETKKKGPGKTGNRKRKRK